MKDIDVLVVGELNVDLILTGDVTPGFGQAEKLVDDANLTIGSSGAIFACGAARLGLRVAYSGVVGDDIFGRFMINNLRARAVDTSGIQADPSLKTGLSVILSHPKDRAILTHLGTIDALQAEQVDRMLLRRARHIHVTSYFLQRALQPGLPALLTEARSLGCTVSMDTNWDPAERWADGLDEALAQVDVFLPNEQEALAIARRSNIADALAVLAQDIPTVVVKLGAEGAMCQQGEACLQDAGFPVDVMDTTGAGDSFDAGFLYGYLQQWPLADSLALACACGSLSTRAAGGTTAQATLEEAQICPNPPLS
ncbi:carbohydrate kinase family protein [Chloroflexota bacterium]